jgi:hypothetical protein
MTSKQLRALAKTMKSLGITHLKTNDIELTMAPPVAEPIPAPVYPPDTTGDEGPPHEVTELKSLWSMSNEALIDRLFPLPKNPEEEELGVN